MNNPLLNITADNILFLSQNNNKKNWKGTIAYQTYIIKCGIKKIIQNTHKKKKNFFYNNLNYFFFFFFFFFFYFFFFFFLKNFFFLK